MELSDYVTKLRGELTSITRFAGEDVAKAAELLAETLESSVRLTLLDVLSAAAADITARLGDTAVEVRLADGEPTFVVLTAPADEMREEPAPAAGADPDAGTARLTLRLPDTLKARIETEAARSGTSVNTWLVRAAGRSLDNPGRSGQAAGRRGPGQRITGYARS
ncbi:MAG TPA: histidine kinase [Streptosporangiaceae bacterium]|nr:histidine kinase [Streptosporangiaceae bacterium]